MPLTNPLTSATVPATVTLDLSTGVTAEVVYSASLAVAGAQADALYNALTYTVPTGYKFLLSNFMAKSADNRVTARAAKVVTLGSYNTGTDVFTSGSSFTSPAFGAYMDAEITTANGGTDVTLTITYTNQDGTAGRSTTVFVGKNTPVGYKFRCNLQAGDFGVQSIQSVSRSASNTGVVALKGVVEFFNSNLTTAGVVYSLQPNDQSMIVRAGELLELAWSSSAAATTTRTVSATGVLVPV